MVVQSCVVDNAKVKNPEDKDVKTPLHLGAQSGHYKIREMIMERFCKWNKK